MQEYGATRRNTMTQFVLKFNELNKLFEMQGEANGGVIGGTDIKTDYDLVQTLKYMFRDKTPCTTSQHSTTLVEFLRTGGVVVTCESPAMTQMTYEAKKQNQAVAKTVERGFTVSSTLENALNGITKKLNQLQLSSDAGLQKTKTTNNQ